MKLKTTLFLMLASLSAACGKSTGPVADVSLIEVAQAAARQNDRITVGQLANWLIEARGDFVLVDVRTSADFEKGQIRDAISLPIAQLVTAETLESLARDRKIVVYSNGSENAAKAEVMLRLAGFDAHLLAGGYNAWQQQILNPDISAEELDGESLQVSAQRAYSCYFVGERSGSAQTRRSDKPFVPPVIIETAEPSELPPLAPEEGC